MWNGRHVWFTVVLLTILALYGCGGKGISDESIVIRQYKGLRVAENADVSVREFEDAIWEELLSNCEMAEYPQAELESLMDEIETQYQYVAYYKDKTSSELVEEIHGMTVEELAKQQLMKEYAVLLIAENEGLDMTSKEYEDEIEKRANDNMIDVATYESMFGEEELKRILLEERVLQFLKDNLK